MFSLGDFVNEGERFRLGAYGKAEALKKRKHCVILFRKAKARDEQRERCEFVRWSESLAEMLV